VEAFSAFPKMSITTVGKSPLSIALRRSQEQQRSMRIQSRNFASSLVLQAQKETKTEEHRQINLDWEEIQKQATLFSKMALPYFKYGVFNLRSRLIFS
jgi:hypothetical protein